VALLDDDDCHDTISPLLLTFSAEPAFCGRFSVGSLTSGMGISVYKGSEERNVVRPSTPLKSKSGLQPECRIWADKSCSGIQWCRRTPLIQVVTKLSLKVDQQPPDNLYLDEREG